MVSYPDSQGAERSLAIRRPPSVASHSSRSTSRRHRQHKSHFGGTSYQPQNEFPVFTHTGDVEIVIANGRKEQRYLLHKLILTQCSGFFEAGTSDEWANAGEGSSSQNHNSAALARIPNGAVPEKKRWRYELDWGKGGDELPMLIQKVCPATSSVEASANGRIERAAHYFWRRYSTSSATSSHAKQASSPPSGLLPKHGEFLFPSCPRNPK